VPCLLFLMKENTDYLLVDSGLHPGRMAVKLLSGRYKGIVYTYNSVSLTEEKHQGKLVGKLSFVYEIESVTTVFTKAALISSPAFHTHIGKVLESIIGDNTFKIGKHDTKARRHYSK
jgi:hypothetical protein